ncbi:MAG: hypothetical protein M0R06_05640 [Sphaerochaeta sp.]|nr:hypothetical protein [Sphaerochaeta sp.]
MKKVMVLMLGLILLLTGMWATAKEAPKAPASTLMSCYLAPSPEFLEEHKNEPVERVYQAWTAKVLVAALTQQQGRLQALEAQHPQGTNAASVPVEHNEVNP